MSFRNLIGDIQLPGSLLPGVIFTVMNPGCCSGPADNLVVIREDEKPLPWTKIEQMYKVYDNEEEGKLHQALKTMSDMQTEFDNIIQHVCTMSISPSEIKLYDTWAHPYDLTGDDNFQELPGCLLTDCVIYCCHSALLRKDLYVNKLANPIIDEHWLTLMAKFGGPVGYLIVARRDKQPLPFTEIKQMYNDYKGDGEGNMWYDMLKEAIYIIS